LQERVALSVFRNGEILPHPTGFDLIFQRTAIPTLDLNPKPSEPKP
jgi:hypothetical protein